MGLFSPPPSSSQHQHSGQSSRPSGRRSGGAPSSSKHSSDTGGSGGGSGSGDSPRKGHRAAGEEDSAHMGPDAPTPVGASPDADLYTECVPAPGECQHYHEYGRGRNGDGHPAAEASSGALGYYSNYSSQRDGNGEGSLSATGSPTGDDDAATAAAAGAAAAAAAAAAASAAGEEYYYTSSVSSAVAGHVYEAGMQFHGFQRSPPTSPTNSANGASHENTSGSTNSGSKLYALPNDETEQNRDDMKHSMALLLMRDRLFYAPVDAQLAAGGMVYDLGTGTGIWAMDGELPAPSIFFFFFFFFFFLA